MKKFILIFLQVIILTCFISINQAKAADLNLEFFGLMGTSPFTEVNTGLAAGLGFGFDLFKLSDYFMFQVRLDASFNQWTGDGGTKIQRIPIFVGVRVPFSFSWLPDWLFFYFEGGPEVVYEKYKLSAISGKSFFLGGALGLGIEFFIKQSIYAGINARYHFSDNPNVPTWNGYFSFGPVVGFRF